MNSGNFDVMLVYILYDNYKPFHDSQVQQLSRAIVV